MIKPRETSIASQEYASCYAELMHSTPHAVLKDFFVRHEQRIEQATRKSQLSKACSRGCAYCCHFKVVADAVEIFAMVDYVNSAFSSQQIEEIKNAAKQNIAEARNLSHEEQATINQKCPLLLDNSCLIYPVRSIKCRNFHATDTANCRASYENPRDLSIINNSIAEVYIAATGSSDGFLAALHSHGYDDRVYDHNAAFIEAMEDDECKRRYDAKKRAFRTARYDND